MKRNSIYCIDALEGLNKLGTSSIDVVCIDPPATIKNPREIFIEINRVLKTDGEFILYTNRTAYKNYMRYLPEIRRSTRIQILTPAFISDLPLNTLYLIEKPLLFVKGLLPLGKEKVVLDVFMGTGTTCIASKELGHQYIGFEIDKEMFEVAKERLYGI